MSFLLFSRHYFNKIDEKHLYTQAYSLDVYSSLEQTDISDEPDGAMLPIYGIKNGEKAFLAAITDGDSSATIKINPGVNTAAVKLNRASFEFTYRNSHRFYLSNIVVNGKDVATNIYGTEWDEQLIPGDRSVRFFILEGKNADYSGMANAYREYLLECGRLSANPKLREYRTSISVIMGAVEKTMFATNYVKATSFEDVLDFVKRYNELGMSNYLLTLSGWNKGGISNYNAFYKPEPSLGGSKGLKRLAELNCDIYLETDITSNFNERNSIKQGNLIAVTNSDETRFIANLKTLSKKYTKLEKKLKKFAPLNAAFLNVGKNVYYNADGGYDFRADEISKLRQLLAKPENLSVQGGNLYLLDLADYAYGISASTSQNTIIDEEIPFFGMVVYGSVPYSSESGNNSGDYAAMRLKWLEYGCVPYFEITAQSPQVLQNSDRNFLYSSRNDYWLEKIAECNKEWNEELDVLCGAYMVKHQRISDTLVRVDYSNGQYVLINYADEAVSYNGIIVKAKDYILAKG